MEGNKLNHTGRTYLNLLGFIIFVLACFTLRGYFDRQFAPPPAKFASPLAKKLATPSSYPVASGISLANIAALSLSEKELNAGAQEVLLVATGDIIPARSANWKTVTANDFSLPYAKTGNLLRHHDILLINLESPLIKDCPATTEGMVFCGDERNMAGLKDIGTDIANLANNHSTNYGREGLANTIRLLGENGISHTGTGSAALIVKKGLRFGFLGFNDIAGATADIAAVEPQELRKKIEELSETVDFVVVSMHWGEEYRQTPDSRQVELAHLAVDSGADLVIGNHPHWVQQAEIYKGKLIAYAHGNFVFDQMWSPETREGVIGQYLFDKNGLKAAKYLPVIIDDYFQPRPAGEKEAEKIINAITGGSS